MSRESCQDSAKERERKYVRAKAVEWVKGLLLRIERNKHKAEHSGLMWCVVHPKTIARIMTPPELEIMSEDKYKLNCDRLVPLGFVSDFRLELHDIEKKAKEVKESTLTA